MQQTIMDHEGVLRINDLLQRGDDAWNCSLRKPTEVGRFSLDGSRKFHHDRRQMSCFIQPDVSKTRLSLDLNDGYGTERFIKRDEDVKERLNHMLHWMLFNKARFVDESNSRKRLKVQANESVIGCFPDFIMWRGHLTKFMCTPYENRDGWVMAVQKLGNTIYISEVESEEARQKRKNRSPRDALMTYWGVRFEGYMTGPFHKPQCPPTTVKAKETTITNTNEAFCSVLRTRLNARHSLMYGAEVDCCKPVDILNPPDCYIELKTSRTITSKGQDNNFFRYKALKWWAQSYLAGIPQITCGFRDDEGYVIELHDFATCELPEKAVSISNSWNHNTCLLFLDNLLQAIKDLLCKCSSHEVVYLFSWNPKDQNIRYNIDHTGQNAFLPEWYLSKNIS